MDKSAKILFRVVDDLVAEKGTQATITLNDLHSMMCRIKREKEDFYKYYFKYKQPNLIKND